MTPEALYLSPPGKKYRYLFNKRRCGPRSWYGLLEKRNALAHTHPAYAITSVVRHNKLQNNVKSFACEGKR
jgi:hypothetical protein